MKMICSNCGKELDSDAKFCPNCGTAQKLQEYNQADDSATIVENVKYYEFHNATASENYHYHYRLYFPLWFDSKFIQEILNGEKHNIKCRIEDDLKYEKKLSSFAYKLRATLFDGTLETIPKYKEIHVATYFFDMDRKKGSFLSIQESWLATQVFTFDAYQSDTMISMFQGKWFIPHSGELIYKNDYKDNKNLAHQDYMEKCERCLVELNNLAPN